VGKPAVAGQQVHVSISAMPGEQGPSSRRGDALLKLRLREIEAALSGATHDPANAPDTSAAEHGDWHDSSLELGRGLDVIELSVDLPWVDAQLPQAGTP
jgi:hypothetical protein